MIVTYLFSLFPSYSAHFLIDESYTCNKNNKRKEINIEQNLIIVDLIGDAHLVSHILQLTITV